MVWNDNTVKDWLISQGCNRLVSWGTFPNGVLEAVVVKPKFEGDHRPAIYMPESQLQTIPLPESTARL